MAPKRKRPSSKDDISGSSAKAKRASKAAVAVEDESMEVVDTETKSTTLFFRRRNTAPKRNKRSTKDESSGSTAKPKKGAKAAVEEEDEDEDEPTEVMDSDEESMASFVRRVKAVPKRRKPSTKDKKSGSGAKPKRGSKAAVAVGNEPIVSGDPENVSTARFLDEPIADSEARSTWPDRYLVIEKKEPRDLTKSKKKDDDDQDEIILARCHYRCAFIDEDLTVHLYDDTYVQAGEGEEPYICRIDEMFEGVDGKLYFTARWFYRACDTVIDTHGDLIDKKRLFFSEIRDINELNCLLKKLNILMIPLTEGPKENIASMENYDYYCDTNYHVPYSTFEARKPRASITSVDEEASRVARAQRTDATLLDLYCGCGAMSTGLCMGSHLSGLNLVTKWAVDMNKYACQSLTYNHQETNVRNESAEDFLFLLKEWEKLCFHFSLRDCPNSEEYANLYGMSRAEEDENDDGSDESDNEDGEEVFEVEKIIAISFGVPEKNAERGLYLRVQWKNYGPDYDTWEPIGGLSNCRERIKEFVVHGFQTSILPLPGSVDVVCGGPPCQGISGYNRFRDPEKPLAGDKNKQLLVYMEIVEFLKPKFVLMENVVDMLKFARGYLGRYAVGRLVQMKYQTRMGMMAAGAYGLAQFRMRFFLWAALPSERLPQFPLPTHDVVRRGGTPVEFEENVVAYEEGHTVKLGDKLLLADVISDLPAVTNDERRDEIPYDKDPETAFQQFIRLSKDEVLGSSTTSKSEQMLYDHHPLNLNKDDYQRVCRVPKMKGANFRNFPGVKVGADNVVEFDPNIPRVYLESQNPLVPDYAMTFVRGTSSKPFGRLWWDETVSTVITRAEPHNHVIIHPVQDRVLTVRENARLQGFPDYYKLFGPTKQKYMQVGNAVAVPVAKALGYALAQAFRGLNNGNDPLFTLPEGFPNLRVNP